MRFVFLVFFKMLVTSTVDCKHPNSPIDPPDLIITIKTTNSNHRTRLLSIIDTWFTDLPLNIFIVTDEVEDGKLKKSLGGQLIATDCGHAHDHASLNCKFQKELEVFAKHDAEWSCHFDDDSFVLVDRLRSSLAQLDSRLPFYVGRPSINRPIYVDGAQFWFATGGAGVCISRPLLDRIRPFISRFTSLTPNFQAPDDVSFGYLITYLLETPLTTHAAFHSHLEPIKDQTFDLRKQASFSPTLQHRIPQMLPSSANHHLFYSVHCYVRPKTCKRLAARMRRRALFGSSFYS